jgi:hypothetical protein
MKISVFCGMAYGQLRVSISLENVVSIFRVEVEVLQEISLVPEA